VVTSVIADAEKLLNFGKISSHVGLSSGASLFSLVNVWVVFDDE